MPEALAFLRCVAQAVVAKGARGLVKQIPFAGEMLVHIADDTWRRWKQVTPTAVESALRQELEQLTQADPILFARDVRQAVLEAAKDQPAEAQQALTQYLALLPIRLRQAFARSDDPQGKTVPPSVTLRGAEELLALLPTRPPRFKPGQTPPNEPRWELLRPLDVDAFGEVWLARQLEDQFSVFKFCLNPKAQSRLLKHAAQLVNRVLRDVAHPSIVRLIRADLQGELPWLQYEHIAGGDLSQLAATWPADVGPRARLATDAVRGLAQAVGYCHRLQPPIVHRDLKPSHILVSRSWDGQVQLKITGLGISGISAGQAHAEVRRATRLLGALSNSTMIRLACAPLYASPEQQRDSSTPHPKDDVHALAVLWFQLFMGNLDRLMGKDYRDDLADLGLCPELIDVLARCAADRADRRPDDAVAMAELIQGLPADLLRFPVDVVSDFGTGEVAERRKREHEEIHARARELQGEFRYAEAVQELEKLVSERRDPVLHQSLTTLRDEVVQLDKAIQQPVAAGRLTWQLRSKLARLLELQPLRDDVERLLRQCPEAPRTFANALKMAFVLVPAGKTWMGGSGGKPGTNQVEIAQAFYLGVHPVTQGQWQTVMGGNPSYFSRGGEGKASVAGLSDADLRLFPVEQVSWDDVREFLRRLIARENDPEWLYRLPTEEEWEYACRGGASSKGDCSFDFYLERAANSLASTQANFDGRNPADNAAKGPFLERTCKVGAYKPNRLGLHDMHGNVWEWTDTAQGDDRVYRGGGWNSYGVLCRASCRNFAAPASHSHHLGFRLARVPSGYERTSARAAVGTTGAEFASKVPRG